MSMLGLGLDVRLDPPPVPADIPPIQPPGFAPAIAHLAAKTAERCAADLERGVDPRVVAAELRRLAGELERFRIESQR